MARFLPKRYPCMLLKTGQTTQYSSKKDDGYYEKGVAKQYTVLSTGQYSGTENITINGKTHVLSNNCVIDHRTGLMWARYVPDGDIGPDGDGKLYWLDAVNGENVFEFATVASIAELGGWDDWRVPNLFELISIADVFSNPIVDGTAFPSAVSGNYWTSTTARHDTAQANYVQLSTYFAALTGIKNAAKYYCRLVRGGAL